MIFIVEFCGILHRIEKNIKSVTHVTLQNVTDIDHRNSRAGMADYFAKVKKIGTA